MQRELAVTKVCAYSCLFRCMLSLSVDIEVQLELGIQDFFECGVVHASNVSDRDHVCKDCDDGIK